MYIYLNVHITCIFASLCACVYAYRYSNRRRAHSSLIGLFVREHMHVFKYLYMCVYVYGCVLHLYMNIYVYVTSIYICLCLYIYVCVYGIQVQ